MKPSERVLELKNKVRHIVTCKEEAQKKIQEADSLIKLLNDYSDYLEKDRIMVWKELRELGFDDQIRLL